MQWLRYAVDYGIIGLLAVLSVVSVAIFIERLLFMKRLDLGVFVADRTRLEIEVTKGLTVIAAIGTNAPYIGLLGTVLGIMFTFYAIGLEGIVDATKIMVGLALALKATAIGLCVAIPSVVFHNLLSRKARVVLLEWDRRHGREGV